MQAYSYTSKPACSASALVEWNFYSTESTHSLVIPDGCRDIIVKEDPESTRTCFISDLSSCSFSVASSPGECMRGLRLQPGVQVDKSRLNSWVATRGTDGIFHLDQLDEFCYRSANLTEALDCLASDVSTVNCAAKQLGISVRSLQRVVKIETGVTPVFWFGLARARKTAKALFVDRDLSNVAFESGYSDQAHMSREMKRWFNLTPVQIRLNKDMHTLLAEPGYS